MPDLQYAALQAWLQEHAPAVANGPVDGHGSRPGGQLSSKIGELGAAIDSAVAEVEVPILNNLDRSSTETFRLVLAHLSPAIRLRLLASLDMVNASESRRTLEACFAVDRNGYGDLNRQTVDEFGRLETLGRVFAPDRLNDLVTACRQADLEGLSG